MRGGFGLVIGERRPVGWRPGQRLAFAVRPRAVSVLADGATDRRTAVVFDETDYPVRWLDRHGTAYEGQPAADDVVGDALGFLSHLWRGQNLVPRPAMKSLTAGS